MLLVMGTLTMPRHRFQSPWTAWFNHWQTTLVDALFPPFCLACEQRGSWFCSSCVSEAEILPLGWCVGCGRRASATTTLCQACRRQLKLTSLTSCFAYRGSVEALIRSIKFKPAAVGLDVLLHLPTVRERFRLPPGVVVVPIPCAPARELRRGFNQAERLAHGLIGSANVRLAHQLERTRDAPAQVGLGAAARATNAAGLYRWTGPMLVGQRVLLVDDVCTTGATLGAAAAALRQAGARWVHAVTIAQTPR